MQYSVLQVVFKHYVPALLNLTFTLVMAATPNRTKSPRKRPYTCHQFDAISSIEKTGAEGESNSRWYDNISVA